MTPARPILVIEDDQAIRISLSQILEGEGYAVVTASNGQEALELLRNGSPRPALILLDLMMPVLDGVGFRTEQRKDPAIADIPVVVMSADNDPSGKFRLLGAVTTMRKPLDLDELLAVIEQHFARSA